MLELNKIYNLDYIEGTKQLEDNSIDFILIDPPYKIGYGNLEWDNKNDFSNFTTKWVKEAVRLLKPTGSILIIQQFYSKVFNYYENYFSKSSIFSKNLNIFLYLYKKNK